MERPTRRRGVRARVDGGPADQRLAEDDTTVVRTEPSSVSTRTETDAVPLSAEAVAEAVASPPFGNSVLTVRVTVELLTVACSSTTRGPC